jgi:hypothetical protein
MPQGQSILALRISKHAARMVKACTTDRNPCGTLWLPPRPKKGGRTSTNVIGGSGHIGISAPPKMGDGHGLGI